MDNSPDYQVHVAMGIAARESKDTAQWELGHLCSMTVNIWGEETLKRYTSDINIGYSTGRSYRQVWVFYTIENRFDPRVADYRINPVLSFTHFKYALRLETLGAALSFLDECIDGAWSTDLAYAKLSERIGRPGQPKLVGEFENPMAAMTYLSSHQRDDLIVKIYERFKVKV